MKQKRLGKIFVDSGAHSLYTKYVIKKGHSEGYAFYESDTFWKYVDEYAEWIKQRLHLIDIYVNVDVIFNPEMTWKVQKYLESEHKLSPLPVVHFNSDMKWLKKYMNDYEYIGIGGVGQEVNVREYVAFGDRVFSFISDDKGIPLYKTHGFALTSPSLLHRYPFWSCDSTAWATYSRYGAILIPKIKNGKYDYKNSPIPMFVSNRSTKNETQGMHINSLSEYERKVVLNYIHKKEFVLGSSKFRTETKEYELKEGERIRSRHGDKNIIETVIEKGLCNDNVIRDFFNAKYYQDLANSLPEWPWRFKHKERKPFS